MKPRTTIILLVLVAVLAAFVMLWESKQPATRERRALEIRPFVFDPRKVDTIEIDGPHIGLRLRRGEGGLWTITKPSEDDASQELAAQLVEGLSRLTWLETLKKEDLRKEDFKRTGLGEAATKVTLRGGKERLLQCYFGAPAPIQGSVYVSLEENAGTFHLAQTPVQDLVAKAEEDWRDTRLLRLRLDQIKRFSLSAGSGTMEFTREARQPWHLVKPLQARASADRVDGVITALLNLKVKPIRDSATPTPEPNSSSLPAMKIELETLTGKEPIELTFQPPAAVGAEVLAESSARKGSFMAPAKLADFWKLQPTHLRDQQLAQIPADQVEAIRIRSLANADVLLEKQGNAWYLDRFGSTDLANQQRVQRLIEGLNSAVVKDFVNDAATNLESYGLNQPFLTVEWQAGGKTSSLQFGQGPDNKVLAKYAGEPSVYEVNPMMLPAILPPDSVKWKGTRIINANLFAVRRIIVAEGEKPAVVLHYSADQATWSAQVADRDVTASLDRAKANTLLNKLTGFDVSDWSTERTAALAALRNPTLTVQLMLTTPGNAEVEAKPQTLTFAPTAPGITTAVYHGRLNEDPDTFLISRDLYLELTQPLLK